MPLMRVFACRRCGNQRTWGQVCRIEGIELKPALNCSECSKVTRHEFRTQEWQDYRFYAKSEGEAKYAIQ